MCSARPGTPTVISRYEGNGDSDCAERGRLSSIRADRNLLLGRPRLEVVDTRSAGPHRVSRCALLLGIATAAFSLVPQVVSREKSVGIQGRCSGGNPWRRDGGEGMAEPRPRGGTKARMRRWRARTRVGVCRRISVEAAAPSGARWEEPSQSPKWSRIASMTSGWSAAALGIRRPVPGHQFQQSCADSAHAGQA